MAKQGNPLPLHVQLEFSDYLKCGRLEHRFLRVHFSPRHSNRRKGCLAACRLNDARKAEEAGGFNRISSRLNRLRPDRRVIQAFSGPSFLP